MRCAMAHQFGRDRPGIAGHGAGAGSPGGRPDIDRRCRTGRRCHFIGLGSGDLRSTACRSGYRIGFASTSGKRSLDRGCSCGYRPAVARCRPRRRPAGGGERRGAYRASCSDHRNRLRHPQEGHRLRRSPGLTGARHRCAALCHGTDRDPGRWRRHCDRCRRRGLRGRRGRKAVVSNRRRRLERDRGTGIAFPPRSCRCQPRALHGAQPDWLILCHEPRRTTIDGFEDFPLSGVEQAIVRNIDAARPTSPDVRCAGISLDTSRPSHGAGRNAVSALPLHTGLPVVDLMVKRAEALVDPMLNQTGPAGVPYGR